MPFIYFLPTPRHVLSAADLDAAGLGYVLSEHGLACAHTTAGPEGQEGTLVISAPGDHAIAYRPDKQLWRKDPKGRFHVGVDPDHRPAPRDLARPRIYPGQSITLLDGNEWTIPRCVTVLADRPLTLPTVFDLAPDGESLTARVHPRYESLCERAFDWWLQWSRQSNAKLTLAQQIQLAADALAVNYRVGKLEAISLLGLWGSDEFGLILRALIDADEIDAYFAHRAAPDIDPNGEKKDPTSPAATSPISSGVTGDSPTTNPASPN